MAVRRPLHWKLGNNAPFEITAAQLTRNIELAIEAYGMDPSVTLSYTATSGNLGTIEDERKQAGAMVTHASTFQAAPDTTTVTTSHAKISQTVATLSNPAGNYSYPCYYDNGIKHMTQADFQDTFIKPAIDLLIDGSDRPGTYRITTSASATATTTAVSANPVYIDTIADVGAYTADASGLGSGSGEVQDQPTTVQNYYLHSVNWNAQGDLSWDGLLMIKDGHLHKFTNEQWEAILKFEMRYAATALTGYKIRYGYYDGSTHTSTGQNRGSGMVDKRTSSQTEGQYQAGADDYRSQDFPSGTASAINTTYLRVRKE